MTMNWRKAAWIGGIGLGLVAIVLASVNWPTTSSLLAYHFGTAQDFAHLQPMPKLEVYRTILFAAGGAWAIYVYKRTRRGQATMRIAASARLHDPKRNGQFVLLVRLTLANASSVVCREVEATATLFSATERDQNGRLLLIAFAEQDPFLNLISDQTEDKINMEPGESIDSELAFLLNRLELLAMRVLIRGKQSRFGQFYDWNTFVYLDPASFQGQTVQLTSGPVPAAGGPTGENKGPSGSEALEGRALHEATRGAAEPAPAESGHATTP